MAPGKVTKRKKASVKSAATKTPEKRSTGKSVPRLRKQLKRSVAKFTQHLEVTPTTIYRWEKSSGRLKLQPHTHKAFAQFHQQSR
jgi:DNA-binding transcriptional regulator YiaG